MNKAILMGRLGRDPELKATQAGGAVCSVSVATNEREKQGQEALQARPTRPRDVGSCLVADGVITPKILRQAEEVRADRGGRIGDVLRAMQAVDDVALARALSTVYQTPLRPDLSPESVELSLLANLTLGWARQAATLPLSSADGTLTVAVADPLDTAGLDDLRAMFPDHLVEPVVIPRAALMSVIHTVFDRRAAADQVVDDLESADIEEFSDEIVFDDKDILDEDDEAPIIRLVNSVMAQAIKERASDIHIEPYEKDILVRFLAEVVRDVVKMYGPRWLEQLKGDEA